MKDLESDNFREQSFVTFFYDGDDKGDEKAREANPKFKAMLDRPQYERERKNFVKYLE